MQEFLLPLAKVLILDDDPDWLDLHAHYLSESDFEVCRYQTAKEAIAHARRDPKIRVSIIDQILLTPSALANPDVQDDPDDPPELQDLQGMGAIEKIGRTRRDMFFVLITDAPKLWSQTQPQFMKATADLRSKLHQTGIPIYSVIHKDEIRFSEAATYQNLIQMFCQWVYHGNLPSVGIININSQIHNQIGIKIDSPSNDSDNSS